MTFLECISPKYESNITTVNLTMKMSVWKKWQHFLATRRPPKALVLALHIWLAAPQVCRLLFSEHYGLSEKAMLKPSIDKTFHTLTDIVRRVIYCAILTRPIFRIPRQSNMSVPNRMNDAGSALPRELQEEQMCCCRCAWCSQEERGRAGPCSLVQRQWIQYVGCCSICSAGDLLLCSRRTHVGWG